MDLPDGGALILSVAKYYSPSGKAIQDAAITPNVAGGRRGGRCDQSRRRGRRACHDSGPGSQAEEHCGRTVEQSRGSVEEPDQLRVFGFQRDGLIEAVSVARVISRRRRKQVPRFARRASILRSDTLSEPRLSPATINSGGDARSLGLCVRRRCYPDLNPHEVSLRKSAAGGNRRAQGCGPRPVRPARADLRAGGSDRRTAARLHDRLAAGRRARRLPPQFDHRNL